MRVKSLMLSTTIGCLLAASAAAVPQSTPTPERTNSAAPESNTARSATNSASAGNSASASQNANAADARSAADASNATRSADASGSSDPSRTADANRSDSRAPSRASAGANAGATPMLMVLVPIAQPSTAQAAMRDGCWAKLYTEEKYGGDSLTLVGPVDMPQMTGPFGVNWADQIESVQTGPRTTLTIYDDRNYRDRAATIRPGQEVPDLEDEKLGFFEDFRSMKIACGAASGSA